MDFKKIFFGFVILIFSNQVSAQMDSTDLDFYAAAPVLNVSEDSIMYTGDGYVGLYLDFEIADMSNIYKIWVEVIQYDFENNASSIFIKSYTLVQLISAGYTTSGQVVIPLVTAPNAYSYQVVLRLEDNQGHESGTITKTLLP